MHQLVENNKGFTTLEVIVVLCIVGILSAFAFPQIMDWNKSRAVKTDVIRVVNIFDNINSQVQRGLYAFAQVYMNFETDQDTGITTLTVTSRGMTADTLGNKITQDMTFRSETDRCSLDREDWDHDGADTDRAEVSQEILNNIETNFNGEEAVCFSKDGRWYSTSNFFQGSNSFEMSGRGGVCDDQDEKGPQCDYRIVWSRFGNIKLEKWNQRKGASGEWVSQ